MNRSKLCAAGTLASTSGKSTPFFHGAQGGISRSCYPEIYAEHGSTENMPEYRAWSNIKRRCYNPKCDCYRHYGGRGIKVCPEWADFRVFWNDMGPRPSPKHSIERIDVNGGYCKTNCTWATCDVQGNNRRNSLRITIDGETMTLAQWVKKKGVKYHPTWIRFKEGITGESLFAPRPPRKRKGGPGRKTKHFISASGATRSLTEWAQFLGCSYQNLHQHMQSGTIEPYLANPEARHRRPQPSKHLATVNGATRSLKEWSRLTGANYLALWKAVKRGLPIDGLLQKAGVN